MSHERATVPCNGCTLCCRADAILLLPQEGDVVESYDCEMRDLPGIGVGPVLKKKAGVNECVYLVDGRCSIWARAPVICRVFDCWRWYLSKTRPARRRMVKSGLADQAVFDAGRERVASLDVPA